MFDIIPYSVPFVSFRASPAKFVFHKIFGREAFSTTRSRDGFASFDIGSVSEIEPIHIFSGTGRAPVSMISIVPGRGPFVSHRAPPAEFCLCTDIFGRNTLSTVLSRNRVTSVNSNSASHFYHRLVLAEKPYYLPSSITATFFPSHRFGTYTTAPQPCFPTVFFIISSPTIVNSAILTPYGVWSCSLINLSLYYITNRPVAVRASLKQQRYT